MPNSHIHTQGMAILGMSVVGSFGSSLEAFSHRLNSPALETEPQCADLSRLEDFFPKRSLRRMDTFSRMALLGARLALENASQEGKSRLGVILASSYGASTSTQGLLDSILSDGDTCASPIHFANSLHQSASANLAILLDLQGPNFTVSNGWSSVASGLICAQSLLHSGHVDRVLFGAVEERSPIADLVNESLGGPSQEGAAFFVLEAPNISAGVCIQDLHTQKTSDPKLSDETFSTSQCRARFGLSPALPAFQLAAAALSLPETQTKSLELSWTMPFEGACQLQSRQSSK